MSKQSASNEPAATGAVSLNGVVLSWADFDSTTKKQVRSLKPIFIMAPRQLSRARLAQIIKTYLPKGNIVLGLAEEADAVGFAGQPQFAMLARAEVEPLMAKVAAAQPAGRQLLALSYPQREVDNVIRKLKPQLVVAVRGSYCYAFHRRSTWHVLQERQIPYELISPFTDEAEAKVYADVMQQKMSARATQPTSGDAMAMMEFANEIAAYSFDYSRQVGCVLAEPAASGYRLVLAAYNAVVPYQTYALHHGNSREENLSALHDANHYDTIHAEMAILIAAMNEGERLEGRSLIISMLPCPNCARTLCQTGLAEVIYEYDHSDGYAVNLFAQCGIQTRQLIPKEALHD